MNKNTEGWFEPLVTISMALVTVVAALAIWRAAMVSGAASDADRAGIIDTIRARSARLQNLNLLTQEIRGTMAHQVAQIRSQELTAAAQSWRQEGEPTLALVAETEATWLSFTVEGLQVMSPMTTEPQYRRPDGSVDLERRMEEIEAENADLRDLDPQGSFSQADQLYRKTRLLVTGTVFLAVALLFYTVAQLLENRLRYVFFALGVVTFLTSLIYLGVVELSGAFT